MHMGLGLGNRIGAEVKDGGREHSACAAFGYPFDKVVERANPARGDHGHADRIPEAAPVQLGRPRAPADWCVRCWVATMEV